MTRTALSLGLGLLLFAATAATAETAKVKKITAKDPTKTVLVQRDTQLRADATAPIASPATDHCFHRY
jgi:hypothetical protein